MRKNLILLLCILMLISLVACTESEKCTECGSENVNRFTLPDSMKSKDDDGYWYVCDDCLEDLGYTEKENMQRFFDNYDDNMEWFKKNGYAD